VVREFLQLWQRDTAEKILKTQQYLGHSASDQLDRVQPDDTVWVATVYKGGDFVLLGRLEVGECTDEEGAKELLDTDDIWPAKYHVLSKPGYEEPLREVSLMDVAEDLRFLSKTGKDRLKVTDGRVNAQQLQRIRRLTPESARMLEKKWSAN
jgi:hypothetical protein